MNSPIDLLANRALQLRVTSRFNKINAFNIMVRDPVKGTRISALAPSPCAVRRAFWRPPPADTTYILDTGTVVLHSRLLHQCKLCTRPSRTVCVSLHVCLTPTEYKCTLFDHNIIMAGASVLSRLQLTVSDFH